MPVKLELATQPDAAAIAALRLAASRQLTLEYGKGVWSFAAESEGGVRADILTSFVLVARDEGTVLATLRLSDHSPWLGGTSFFTPAEHPLYLTSMAVSPKWQRRGIGRICLEQAKRFAAELQSDAIRLDAYDAAAGAGDFYRKCGFREILRAPYNGTPLIFFEFPIPSASLGRSAVANVGSPAATGGR